jgi:hypothetical protein
MYTNFTSIGIFGCKGFLTGRLRYKPNLIPDAGVILFDKASAAPPPKAVPTKRAV